MRENEQEIVLSISCFEIIKAIDAFYSESDFDVKDSRISEW